jgi:hypothetical protein
MENIEKKRIESESESELEIAPEAKEVEVVEVATEVKPEEYSEFFAHVNEQKEKSETINIKIEELLSSTERPEERVDSILQKTNVLSKEIEELRVFFDDRLDEQRSSEYFYASPNYYNAGHYKTRIDHQLEILKRIEQNIKETQEGVAKRRERIKKEKEKIEDAKETLEEKKGEIMKRCEEIEKDLGGIMGKFKKKKYEEGILEKIDELKEGLGSEVVLPEFSDTDLRWALRDYSQIEKVMNGCRNNIEREEEWIEKGQEGAVINSCAKLQEIGSSAQENHAIFDNLLKSAEREIEWQLFFENVFIEEMGVTEEDKEREKERMTQEDLEMTDSKERSFENIRGSLAHFLKHLKQRHDLSGREALDLIKKEVEKVKKSRFVTITRGENGLTGLLREGKLRCIWEFSDDRQFEMAKNSGDKHGYLRRRKHLEQGLDVWGKNPISASLNNENGHDENITERRQYGEYLLVLDDNVIDRSIYTEGDTMNGTGILFPLRERFSKYEHLDNIIKKRGLSPDHACIAKALYNLYYYDPETGDCNFPEKMGDNFEYIEALITGGVALEDVKEVVVKNIDDVPEDIKKLLEEKGIPLVTKVTREKSAD